MPGNETDVRGRDDGCACDALEKLLVNCYIPQKADHLLSEGIALEERGWKTQLGVGAGNVVSFQ